jgi:hypothetical protein
LCKIHSKQLTGKQYTSRMMRRQTISHATKQAVLTDLDNGISRSVVMQKYNLPHQSNITSILRQRRQVEQHYQQATPTKEQVDTSPPPPPAIKPKSSSSSCKAPCCKRKRTNSCFFRWRRHLYDLRRMAEGDERMRLDTVRYACPELVHVVCELAKNVLRGRIRMKLSELECLRPHKDRVRRLAQRNKAISLSRDLRRKKRYLRRSKHILPALLCPVLKEVFKQRMI